MNLSMGFINFKTRQPLRQIGTHGVPGLARNLHQAILAGGGFARAALG
jgi:hypothetical protein